MKCTVAFKSQWQVLWQRNLTADVIKSAVLHLQPAETLTNTEDTRTHRRQCLHTGKQRHVLSVAERLMCSDYLLTTYSVFLIKTRYCCKSATRDNEPHLSSHQLGFRGLLEIITCNSQFIPIYNEVPPLSVSESWVLNNVVSVLFLIGCSQLIWLLLFALFSL